MFTQYRLVLLHTLLKPVLNYDFEELLDLNASCSYQECYNLKCEIGEGKDLLFLIDTLNHPLIDIQRAIQFFPKASLIFTCQSERVHSIRDLIIKYTEQYLKVIGFSPNGKEAYITASLSHGLHLEFTKWTDQNRFELALTYRPLYCTMLIELCTAKQLPDSLCNLTDLYKLFVLSIISKHIGKVIEGYSDLQSHDIDKFLSIASSATSEGGLPVSVEQSFGLTKHIKPFCSKKLICTFIHPSIQDYFLALYICLISSKEKLEKRFPNPIPYSIIRFLIGLGRAHDIYLLCNEMEGERVELCLQLFETKSPRYANDVCDKLCNHSFVWDVKLEADPLYWYIFGWCLQSCELQWTLTYDVEKFFHTPLCLEMLHDGSKSSEISKDPMESDGSVSSVVKLVKIIFNGGNQLHDSLCKLLLLKAYTTKVKELNLSGTLDCSVDIDGLELNNYMPNLESLTISCQSSFGLPWKPMICSLPKLEHLSTLHICGTNTQDISTSLSTSIKACKSLHKLRIERVSSEVLEDVIEADIMMTLPGCIYITDSTITDTFAEKIGDCLVQQICKFHKLVFGRCVAHKAVLRTMLKNVLHCSAMKAFCLYGVNSVGNEGAQVIADVIKTTPVVPLDHKNLLLHDTTISKSAMEQVINATSENRGIDLIIPIKYKFDFMACKDVLYISDSQMIEFTYT